MGSNVKLCTSIGRELEDATMCRKIIGSLIYLSLTRSDIAFVVGVLSRYMKIPRKPHLDAIHIIMRYIKTTFNYGVRFKREKDCKISGYCDVDYAGDVNTCPSTTGYIFMLGSIAISWCSKCQPTISISTIEAEYRVAAIAAQESVCLVQLLQDLN